MDGLDIYIDDYGKPDPIPLSMLRRMNQAAVLGLFDDEVDAAAKARAAGQASPDGAALPRWHSRSRAVPLRCRP